jgi:hypothetical protein
LPFLASATAYYDGYELPDVDLLAELHTSTGSPYRSVEETNFNGVADFKDIVPISDITQSPFALITFDDQAAFGDDSCTIDFSGSNLDWPSIINR